MGWGDKRENNPNRKCRGVGIGWTAKLVPNIGVSVPNEPEHMEAEC